MTTSQNINAFNNIIYVVDRDRDNKLYIEEMTELEYINSLLWLTKYKNSDFNLQADYESIEDEVRYDSYNEETEALSNMSDDELMANKITHVNFCLDSERFNSWSDLFDAVYDKAYNESPDNVPSYFGSEKDAQAAIDEWTTEEDE